MRFEVSQVMDTIEQRLTTDVVMAQAVVDLGDITRYTELDSGRPVNLIRIGMVVDALGRYLRDGGAMIYPVAPRMLLSDQELTAKERMVLGRWTDDGLIEATQETAARVLEIAELTGLPIISRHDHADLAVGRDWLRDAPLRVLTVSPRGGGALLTDGKGGTGGVVLSRPGAGVLAARAVAAVRIAEANGELPAPVETPDRPDQATAEPDPADGHDERKPETTDGVPARPADAPVRAADAKVWPDPAEPVYEPLPEPPAYLPAPSDVGVRLIARAWRCDGYDCPSFGPDRRLGQPIPRLRRGQPYCPRHEEPLTDTGPRPPSVPVTLIVDGLRRRHFVVMADRPVHVGRAPDEPDGVAVGDWLHEAASSWISRTHVKLEITDGKLVATDLSRNGTVVWVRTEPGDRPDTYRLSRGRSYPLGEWDSVEMYTGIELCRADRRPKGVDESHDEPHSVLRDAPTVALRLPTFDRR